MKKLISFALFLAILPFAQAKNDRDNTTAAQGCTDCETVAPCVDCDAAALAPCMDCATEAAPTSPAAAAPAAPLTRKEARQAWQAMSKTERKEAKSFIRSILEHTPLAMATSELKDQVHAYKAQRNNTASMDAMVMDETIRLLLIILLVLVCLSILIGILS